MNLKLIENKLCQSLAFPAVIHSLLHSLSIGPEIERSPSAYLSSITLNTELPSFFLFSIPLSTPFSRLIPVNLFIFLVQSFFSVRPSPVSIHRFPLHLLPSFYKFTLPPFPLLFHSLTCDSMHSSEPIASSILPSSY